LLRYVLVASKTGEEALVEGIVGSVKVVLGEAWDIRSPSSVASRYSIREASRASSSSLVKCPR